ncbi:DUF4362 domain-containing protein [Sporosarcina highlanderae]|uniref:DUF4362 domain-containing protein n=1 Tax=Sporosarcina highlanderae TaxID=3035916 RepID=A0ABT8JV62_9BACL|nr:DUF4362 domain-containing protein [Sporosarcina highlanderae]MDN4608668.1 DUF4362 domain-containing protein [Sporosarcina highlanderae]
MLRNIAYIILLITFLFIITACEEKVGEEIDPIDRVQGTDSPRPTVKGVENVDVLKHVSSINGLERMERFYKNTQQGVSSDLRIVHYTFEGAPIVTDLNYDGETMKITFDTSRNKYGSGEITTTKCSKLVEEVNPTNTTYIAVDCSDGRSGMVEILALDYNLKQQDLFEFELKFGNGLKNEVNTNTRKTTRVNSLTKIKKTNDLQMSPKVKQEVFKRLVLTLSDIELETNCHTKKFEEYNLKVYINSAEEEFHWSSCDKSSQGAKFTKIAEYIIAQSEMEQEENPETVIQGYILKVKDDTLLIGVDFSRLEYEWLKNEIGNIDLSLYAFKYIFLEGVENEEFKIGDKIEAVLNGSITNTHPGKAKVKEIKRINVPGL